MKITFLIENTNGEQLSDFLNKAINHRKRSNVDEYALYEGILLRIEKDDTVESLTEKYLQQTCDCEQPSPQTFKENKDVNISVKPFEKRTNNSLRAHLAGNFAAAAINKKGLASISVKEEINSIAKGSVELADAIIEELENIENNEA